MKYILVINSGSATLKVKVFEARSLIEKLSVIVERVGLARSFLVYKMGSKSFKINFSLGIKDHRRALKEVIKVLPDRIYKNIKIVGHRIVHGGEEFVEPTVLNKTTLQQISRYNDFAPIHNPLNLKTAQAAMLEFPRIKHLAVFDTQFFKDLAEHVYLYSIPIKYYQYYGIRKYGFHGLSHENMQKVAQAKFGGKKLNLITCHIGNGISLTAIKEGKVFDTTMGLTPLSGVTMGSRSGDIDPFIPLFLIKELQIPADEVYNILNSQSGLKGISGVSDFRDLLYLAGVKVPAYKPNLKRTKRKRELALLALKVYIYNIQRYVASFSGLLGKVDAVIFSGGVGEHNKFIRQQILSGVNFIKKPRVLIVKADEELMIAKKIMEL